MFNENLKKLRLKQGLSQKFIADYLNISPQSVSKWEKGDALPSILFLPQLAECLSCDINEFFIESDEPNYDIEMLDSFFLFMRACILEKTKKPNEFVEVSEKYPDIVDVIKDLENKIKEHKTINHKTIKSILGVTDEVADRFVGYFIAQEWMEPFDGKDTYYVLKSNIGGLSILASTFIIVIEEINKQKNST